MANEGSSVDFQRCSTESGEVSRDIQHDNESKLLSDRFEWRETPLTSPPGPDPGQLDGMASLPTGNTESGYLGE